MNGTGGLVYEDLEPLYDEGVIQEKVADLAGRISRDYLGKEIIVLCVLKAAAIFAADLARSLTIHSRLAFVNAASYGTATTSSGDVAISRAIDIDIMDKHVLIVDTIVDSGRTLAYLQKHYRKRRPASIRTAVLLDKRTRRTIDVQLDYVGFEIPDRFVVGYGMDFAEKYRNLPYIAALSAD
ncbi:MAG: hypoxanthine phosphoribosyltransferase [Nitrospirota bacterium]|nr:hypoxanthine phosphoribosyltransferase [Nitrospirota bacterium]